MSTYVQLFKEKIKEQNAMKLNDTNDNGDNTVKGVNLDLISDWGGTGCTVNDCNGSSNINKVNYNAQNVIDIINNKGKASNPYLNNRNDINKEDTKPVLSGFNSGNGGNSNVIKNEQKEGEEKIFALLNKFAGPTQQQSPTANENEPVDKSLNDIEINKQQQPSKDDNNNSQINKHNNSSMHCSSINDSLNVTQEQMNDLDNEVNIIYQDYNDNYKKQNYTIKQVTKQSQQTKPTPLPLNAADKTKAKEKEEKHKKLELLSQKQKAIIEKEKKKQQTKLQQQQQQHQPQQNQLHPLQQQFPPHFQNFPFNQQIPPQMPYYNVYPQVPYPNNFNPYPMQYNPQYQVLPPIYPNHNIYDNNNNVNNAKANNVNTNQQQQQQRVPNKQVHYKPKTIKDYKMKYDNKVVKQLPAGLGPNIGSKEWQEKHQRALKMKEYSKQIETESKKEQQHQQQLQNKKRSVTPSMINENKLNQQLNDSLNKDLEQNEINISTHHKDKSTIEQYNNNGNIKEEITKRKEIKPIKPKKIINHLNKVNKEEEPPRNKIYTTYIPKPFKPKANTNRNDITNKGHLPPIITKPKTSLNPKSALLNSESEMQIDNPELEMLLQNHKQYQSKVSKIKEMLQKQNNL